MLYLEFLFLANRTLRAQRTQVPSGNYLAYADRMRRQAGKSLDMVQVPPALDTDFDVGLNPYSS